jgi:uncharacterized cupredoxin-like copper-binding protein
MRRALLVVLGGFLLIVPACSRGSGTVSPGGWSTIAALPGAAASPSPSAVPSPAPSEVTVGLGQTDPMHMFIHLSSTQASSGRVTFVVTNQDSITHEFVVLKTDTPAAEFPIGSFEGETDRIDEDAAGTNVGETGDMKAGVTMTLAIPLAPGHYALVCNLPGHYRMGMHQDFTVV